MTLKSLINLQQKEMKLSWSSCPSFPFLFPLSTLQVISLASIIIAAGEGWMMLVATLEAFFLLDPPLKDGGEVLKVEREARTRERVRNANEERESEVCHSKGKTCDSTL